MGRSEAVESSHSGGHQQEAGWRIQDGLLLPLNPGEAVGQSASLCLWFQLPFWNLLLLPPSEGLCPPESLHISCSLENLSTLCCNVSLARFLRTEILQ